MDYLLWPLILQAFLIFLNAVFACAEIAIISMNDAKLAKMAEDGNKRAVRLARLTSQPARFLATIQVAITLSGFLGSAFAADNFSGMIAVWIKGLGSSLSVEALQNISVIVITLILSYFTLVFGELVPKRIAMKKSEKLALGLSGLISFIAKLFAPIVWLLTASTNVILRLFGIDPNEKDEHVSEEEIRMMVDVGTEKGVIDEDEKNMIQNVFEFDDRTVGEFATHRTDIDVLWADEGNDEWEKIIHETRHSVYPVCDDTVDNVVGVMKAKDFFRFCDLPHDELVKNAVHAPYFIPESIRADILFRQMKKTRNHFAVVLDEYGGLLGIVTLNDLLEQIVGDLDDEDDDENEPDEITKLEDGTWLVRGQAPIDEVADALDIYIDPGEYDTIGGLIFNSYGSIPDDGSRFETDFQNMHVQVLEIRDHMIEKATITIELPPESDADEDEAE